MKIAQRLIYDAWRDETLFRSVLDFLTKHAGAVDEITLFSGNTHDDTPLTLSQLREEQPLLTERMAQFRRAGFASVGINVLVTIGHIDETDPKSPLPFQKIVGYRGDVSTVCCCPAHEDFVAYTREKYRLYAQTRPDFIWVDDDIKLFWNGVKFGCFCPACLRRFREATGLAFTRESLTAELEKPERGDLRALWVRDVCGRITKLLGEIRQAVREVDPGIRLGFMTQRQSWSTYNGMDFPAWFGALDAEMGRPGEGYYFDTVPEDVLVKALSTAQQAFAYPDTVTDVQYELENFPGGSWQKSDRLCQAELELAAAQGMNGALLNTCHTAMGFRGQDTLYACLAANRPVWDAFTQATAGLAGRGFWPAFSERYDQLRPLHPGESFFTTYEGTARHDVTRVYALAKLGVPLTMNRRAADGVILSGDLAEGFTREELLDFLRGAVLLDGTAAAALERMGLARYTGVVPAGTGAVGLLERMNMDDPVNRELLLDYRDVRPAFFGGSACYLRALSPAVRQVSTVTDHDGTVLGLGTTLYTNELGGRVCVMGYAPFLMANDVNRFLQLQALCGALTGSALPGRLLTPGKTLLFLLSDAAGTHRAATLMNLTLDTKERVRVALPGCRAARMLIPGAGETPLSAEDGVFTIPTLPPFRAVYLLAEA